MNIKEFPNYYVTTNGTVINSKGNQICRFVDNTGYYQVELSRSGKKYKRRVHQLIAHTILGQPPKGYIINHKDGNKLNNRIENLEYITYSENTQHAYDNGLIPRKRRTKLYSINKKSGMLYKWESIRSCARGLDINRKTLSQILKGDRKGQYSWRFVTSL